jgi:tetratricopeptide (TPR) repeat protein
MFYLGRELYERKRFEEAIHWMQEYLKVGKWDAEIAEAHITIARCYWFTHQGDKARAECLQAIRTNPDFKEALMFMAVMHYEPWKHKWQRLADAATNEGVLFIRV